MTLASYGLSHSRPTEPVMTRSVRIRLRPGGSRTHSLRNWRLMGSVNRHKIRTLLSLSTLAQNRRPKSKVPALVLASGWARDSVGVTAFQGAGVGAGVMG